MSGHDESEPTGTEFTLRYPGPSGMVGGEDADRLAMFANQDRESVSLDATLRHPIAIREALSALRSVVAADYRYVPKDRTAYLAYQRMRRESANLGAWQAQRAYFDWLIRNDPLAWCILDPVITVHPDKVFFEVFSRDESAYANLSISHDALEMHSDPVCGTTNIDFSDALHDGIQQFRTYRPTRLTVGESAVRLATEGKPEVLEKKIRVPDSWLRGFLQVQSAALLPSDTFRLAAVDLYNALRYLRMHRDIKGRRRGIRVELVPGQRVRMVLEPWETVIEGSAEPYVGPAAKVVRVWGRRRLAMLSRMLPFVDSVEVHVLGSGLPSFWVLASPLMTMTIGLTGFTASNWAKALDLDLLLPRDDGKESDKKLQKILQRLSRDWVADAAKLSRTTKLTGESLWQPLQTGCQLGRVMYDLPSDAYRYRPLVGDSVEMPRLQYRSGREREAFDLVRRQKAITIVSENRIAGTGVELTGRAVVKEDKREYRPQMLIGDEGMVSRAECTCNLYRTQGLKAGPCAHLTALRLEHTARQRDRRGGPVAVDTQVMSRRDDDGEMTYQLTLNHRTLKIRWGRVGGRERMQQFRYATESAAQEDFQVRKERLLQDGYLSVEA